MFRSIGNFEWYPGKGSEGDTVTGVVVGKGSDTAYAGSFLAAASHMAAEIAKPSFSSHHQLAIPTLYCFRHALELMLKSLLREVDAVLTSSAATTDPSAPPPTRANVFGSHSLILLERELTAKLRYYNYDFLTDRHRSIIARIHDLDPSGESFRYGLDKSGQLQLPNGWEVQIAEVEAAVREVFEQLYRIWYIMQGYALSNPIDHRLTWSY